jgi:hypothetical protein
MQSKWLSKSATSVVLVAVMAAETISPVPARAGVPVDGDARGVVCRAGSSSRGGTGLIRN